MQYERFGVIGIFVLATLPKYCIYHFHFGFVGVAQPSIEILFPLPFEQLPGHPSHPRCKGAGTFRHQERQGG
jgi:hypothetical protein